jgi:serine/threonine-protein phosphatase 2A regulatory subunit A
MYLSQHQKSSHLQYFANLCRDDAPMVRRIASRNLGALIYKVAEAMGPSSIADNGPISTTLLDLLELLAGGDQPDSVRLHTTENCVCFGNAMTLLKEKADPNSMDHNEESITTRSNALVKRILPLVVATIDDRSWRVRWTAASKFALVVKAFSSLNDSMDALVPAYEKLLQDPEAEVRTSATLNLAEVAKTGSKVYPVGWLNDDNMDCDDLDNRITIAERLVQRVMTLTEDDSENVRAALAMVATELAPLLGKDITISHLLPPMLLLLRDSTSEVRLNIISSLTLLNDVIGEELLCESLLPAILDLAEDGKWRIRMAVIERMPLLAKQLGKDFFNDKLLELCVGWLGDDISSIREAAAKNLKELTTLLGADWAIENLLPRVKAVMEHPSYLRRTNAVQGIVYMGSAMDVNTTQNEVLPILLEMACDTVPNVRFNVAKGLGVLGPSFNESVYESQITPILDLLNDDPDRDVRYFAGQTGDSLKGVFQKEQ